jgi:hypothetical protein
METERLAVGAIFCGITVGLFFGGIAAATALYAYRRLDKVYADASRFGENRTPEEVVSSTAIFMGMVERAFFTIVTAYEPATAPAAMMTWLAVKMLTNLNRQIFNPSIDSGDAMSERAARDVWDYRRRVAIGGLVGSFVSLVFAYLAGLTIRFLWPYEL